MFGIISAFTFLRPKDMSAAFSPGSDLTNDYGGYADVDITSASLELVEEIAFLDIYTVPESLRDTILQARDVMLNSPEWWVKCNPGYHLVMSDSENGEAWLIGENETGGFAFEVYRDIDELEIDSDEWTFVEAERGFAVNTQGEMLVNAGKHLTGALIVEPEFSARFPDWEFHSPPVSMSDDLDSILD